MTTTELEMLRAKLNTMPTGLMDRLNFVRHRDSKGETDDYLILAEYPEIDYTLLIREAKYEPFVAAWGYNKEGNYWSQGHYFSDLIDATNYIQFKLDEKRKVEKIEIEKDLKDDMYDVLTDEIEYYIYESGCANEHEATIQTYIKILKALGYEEVAEEYDHDYEEEISDGEN